MKRTLISSAVLLSLAAGMLACSGQYVPGLGGAATPTLAPYSIPITYLNVSLVTPPYYTNKVVAEQADLRDQRSPADDVPVYVRIIIREGDPYIDFRSPERSSYYSPDSQVLVYPLEDLVQTFPEAAAAAQQLTGMLTPGEAPPPRELPFWPLVTFSGVAGTPLQSFGRPVLTAHRQHVDFGSGRGVRYLTLLEYDPPRPNRMSGLIYTFQGLTNDRKYYVSVIVPLSVDDNSPTRTETQQNLENLAEQAVPDYGKIAEALEAVAPDQFGLLSLAECDALVKSLVVSP